MTMNKAAKFILDIFFPNRCPFCDGFIKWDELCCAECDGKIERSGNICSVCGKPECICDSGIHYDGAVVPFLYEDVSKKGILTLKTGHGMTAAEYFGNAIADRIHGEYDMIVPVPMTKKKIFARGYNQAELIAKTVSAKTGIPVVNDALCKKSDKEEQHNLSREERIKHISGLFGEGKKNIEGKNILLCDDVITTTATVNECARILKDMGAKTVTVTAVATTPLKNT